MTNLAGIPVRPKEPKAAKDPAYLARVAELPCVCCKRPGPSIVHHCISGRYGTRKASDRETISLCSEHHDYWHPTGIHAGKASWEAIWGNDYDYLPVVADMLAGELTP